MTGDLKSILIIDNFDSFTYNLLDEFTRLGHHVRVVRNNLTQEQIDATIRDYKPHLLVFSPGPGTPDDSGITQTVIKNYYDKIPMFGVCLGHQTLAVAFGGKVQRLDEILHGKVSRITHTQTDIFKSLQNPLLVARYHSLGITELPTCFEVLAWKDDLIMAIKHKSYPCWGVQFHPESILSPAGIGLIQTILTMLDSNTEKIKSL